jgi:hypothetical protein
LKEAHYWAACFAATVACSGSTDSESASGNCTDTGITTSNEATDANGLKPFRSPTNPGAGGVWFTASGEVLALGGYGFPPDPNGIAFVDGWEMRFERLLVTFDNITLAQNPDLNPGEQSQMGSVVARVNGPWAVDLRKGGAVPGKGGSDERAVPIASLTGQNTNRCASFNPTERYALSYDVVAATPDAMSVNLDADGALDYAEMVARQYAVLYVGTATWKAGDSGTACTPVGGVFDQLPKVVHFRLGFKTPTSYLNCQNPDNDPAEPLTSSDEHLRGLYTYSNKSATVQLTLHTDHPFWDSPVHDAPLHFDQIAAHYVGATETPTASIEDFVGADYTNFTDATGAALPWRNCLGSLYTPPDNGTMHFDPAGLALPDYASFMVYNLSTAGHLNSVSPLQSA